MVDRKARREYAQLVRQFISGRMTNDAYEDNYHAISRDADDTAISEIYDQIWLLYDDMKTHHMTGAYRLDREGRRTIAQAVLFLQAGEEYRWPKDAMLECVWALFAFLIGTVSVVLMCLLPSDRLLAILAAGLALEVFLAAYFSVAIPKEARKWKASGDKEAWPFLHQADLADAAQHPRLLNGQGQDRA